MFSRVLGIPVLLAAAVGVPYVANKAPSLDGLWNATPATGTAPRSPKSALSGLAARRPGATAHLGGRSTSVALHEVLRFDVSKEWVYQRWARKSTALSELGLYGVRVALVTGTELQDVAGSLTYFFGKGGRVQRISFRGRTGDTTQLVQLAAQRYGLQRQPSAIVGEQLFQVRRGKQVFSELRTRPASVLWEDSPHDSFMVNLELQHSEATSPLPSQLLPLPVAQPQQQPKAAKSTDQEKKSELADAAEDASEDKTAKKGSGLEMWKAFFPRSRVPSEQVESLDKRGRFW